MLQTFLGLPLHPLLVHLAVISVPVAAILVIIWAIRPSWSRLGTVATGVSLLAFVATLIARSSGEAFLPLLGYSEENPGPVADHARFANVLTVAVIALAIVVCVAWYLIVRRERRGALTIVLRVLMGLIAIWAIVAVVITGHEGAVLVWTS